tara:strand:- start:990 stop:1400 length:411 start_codon:yes stop_codon:yes gene_type:complete
MSEEQQISIIKLMDGSTIVGKVQVSGDSIEIEHPIELVSHITPGPGAVIGEQINLRPWVAIAEDHSFVVERYQVITMSTLQQGFREGYDKMVNQIYFEEPKWRGALVKPEDDFIDEDLDVDTLTELADAMLKNKIH